MMFLTKEGLLEEKKSAKAPKHVYSGNFFLAGFFIQLPEREPAKVFLFLSLSLPLSQFSALYLSHSMLSQVQTI